MKQLIRISRLDRVITVLDGSAQLENPYDVRNLRLQGYDSYIRYGYNTVRSAQATYTPKTAYGLGWFQGVSQITGETKATPKEEFITIEQAGSPSAIRPYLRDATTLAPTQIGTSTLVAGYWNFANYNNYVYAINPKADKLVTPQPTVYKHLIGETVGAEAWNAIQDSAYTSPNDPTITVTTSPYIKGRNWKQSTTDTYSYPIWADTHFGSTIQVSIESGDYAGWAKFRGGNDDNGPEGGQLQIQCIYASTEDYSGGEYLYLKLEGLSDMRVLFASSTMPQFLIGGVWQTALTGKWYQDGKSAVYICYIKGLTLTAVEGFRFSVFYDPERSDSSGATPIDFLRVSPIYIGGVYLEATLNTQRIWDNPLVGDGITYGIRFSDSTGTIVSSIAQKVVTKEQAQGFNIASYAPPSGSVLQLSTSNFPAAPYDRVQFLRLDGTTWRIINTKTLANFTYQDMYQEYQLSGLPSAGTGTTPNPAPAFRTAGIIGAFAYKQSMVWLINQTYQNLQFSRVGDPLELYDSTASLGYDPEDVTVPAQFTLADDQADVPVWGTQAGQIAFIIGETAAYAMVGDFPKSMSPSRQIPGSRGIAGYYAGTRFRSYQGIWGAAYADPELNIWLVNSVPRFVGDASVQPQELSLPVRGKLKDFLYTTQQPEYGAELKIEDVKVVFQESVSSLWVILGHRAAVYRQDMVGNGWELYDYSLASTGTISTCTPYFTNGASATEYSTGTTWTNFGLPFLSDDSYCLNTFSLGAGTNNHRTKYLDCNGYVPVPLIPANATITGVSWRLEDSKTGDLAVTNIHAHPTHNGTPIGSNLATNRVVTTSDVTQTFTMVSLPTLSQLNSGQMGIDIRYESEEWLADWQNPANYTVVITPTSPQVRVPADPIPYVTVYTVTITYTAGGTKPPYAFVNLTGQTTIGGDVVPILGTGTTDNGLGGTNSGQIGTLAAVPPDPPVAYTVSTNTTVRQKVLMSAGVGTYQVTMTSDGTLPTNKFQATHTLTGVFDPATLATVRVDNVSMQICYNVTTTGTEIQWSRVVFSPNGKNVGFRSSGELDVIEYDYRNSSFISGTNRDGGIAPPDWYFVTQQIQWDGAKARLASVQYHGQNATDLIQTSLSVDDGAYVNGALAGVNTSRWYGWHPSISSGIRHKIKFTGSETDSSLKGFALEFNTQSKGKPK